MAEDGAMSAAFFTRNGKGDHPSDDMEGSATGEADRAVNPPR